MLTAPQKCNWLLVQTLGGFYSCKISMHGNIYQPAHQSTYYRTTYLTTYPPTHLNYLPKYKPVCRLMCKQVVAYIHTTNMRKERT